MYLPDLSPPRRRYPLRGPAVFRAIAVFAAIGLSGFLASWTPVPVQAQEPGDAAKGLGYALQNCAECHGVREDERVSPRFNIATFKRIADTPGMTGTALHVWFQTPHPTMPNLILEEADKRDVIAYIVSLKSK